MVATRTEKSRLSIDLATHLRGEIINSDKMQAYKGLEIVTNKITHTEKQGVRHYLLVEIEPDSDFTAEDFCLQAIVYIEGIVDEVGQIFIPDAYYTKGIRRSIGFPEMDRYLSVETNIDEDDESKKMLLQSSIANIKLITRLLICHQLDKIHQLINEKMWLVHHIIPTDIFKGDTKKVVDEA
ncbi:adenylate isopentenyltransferase 5, chloroplastic-like [Solanum stenotomum]|uniref:adenylate isopentenyltransferase 5, chloroplastic-like n=1 Tax=Solanum stenotomum TaxID=172797 RepID=UPI0020D0C697|nr:adenylate isopentenyltransferase 5, chloroplastic-like [Solanum stenotomum]